MHVFRHCGKLVPAMLLLVFLPTLSRGQRDTQLFIPKEKVQRSFLKINHGPIAWGQVSFPALDTAIFASPLTSEIRLGYEVPVSPKTSVNLGLSYLTKNILFELMSTGEDTLSRDIRNLSIKGLRVQAGYRFYLSKKKLAPNGFFVGPHASYAYARLGLKTGGPGYYLNFINWNISCLFGVHKIFANTVSLELITGLGYRSNTMEIIVPRTPVERHKLGVMLPNIKFTLAVNLGIPL